MVGAADCDLKRMSIQQLIETGETETVSKRLVGSEAVPLLTEGFTFNELDRTEANRRTPERLNDPDVVAFRSIATAALTSGQSRKLASVMWLAVYPFGANSGSMMWLMGYRNSPRLLELYSTWG